MIRNWFVSPDDGRVRAGWRILYQLLLFFTFSFIFGWLGLKSGLLSRSIASPKDLLFNKMFEFASLALSIYLARRLVDRRSFESLGFQDKSVVKDLLAGLGIAFLMMALIQLILVVTGLVAVDGFVWQQSNSGNWLLQIFLLLVALLLVSVIEETMFRGYFLNNIEEGLDTKWAVILTSLIFALFHIGNPGGLAWMALLGIFLAGVFFAYAYLRTRTFGLVIGLHLGWNFFLGPVFGLSVSGLEISGLMLQTVSGPELITGGAFGPEAGLVLYPALLLGWWLVKRFTQDRV